jgi:biotin synthase-like enzyme
MTAIKDVVIGEENKKSVVPRPTKTFSIHDTPLTESDKKFVELIAENNKTHIVDAKELRELITKAGIIHKKNFDNSVWLERSIFTNWTCGIADCRYCYLSTKPKLDMKSLRSPESIIGEAIVCKAMGWKVGYITGGLRVESTEYMVKLLDNLHKALGYKTNMNYGPYTKKEIESFAPHIKGLGCAIESFDADLHKFICPSKPLGTLLRFLGNVQEAKLEKFITIILGIGEKMSDVEEVIARVGEFHIERVQLCFLKPQKDTVFEEVPAPDIEYMAWWAAKLRIAHPKLILKVALVIERIQDTHVLLNAGVNCFSRYMVFDDYATPLAESLVAECKKAKRELVGHFTTMPQFDVAEIVNQTELDAGLKVKVILKAEQYKRRLTTLVKKYHE